LSATTRANYKQATYATGTSGIYPYQKKNKFQVDFGFIRKKKIFTPRLTYKYP
jgi:hypothetical protein